VRTAAVLQRLRELIPIRVTVMAACNRRIWPPGLGEVTEAWHDEPCDVGVVQSDDVTVDIRATAASLDRWLNDLPSILGREEVRLAGGYDLVLGDVPPPAFEAAYRLQIPSVAVANFSWDWIYRELGFDCAADTAASAYAKATLLLEATPFGPMPAFPRRVPVGLVARAPSASREAARTALGIGEAESVALLAFQPASAPSVTLPTYRRDRLYLAPTGWPLHRARSDVQVLPATLRFEDALAAADVVVGKPGYGLIGDVEAAGARFLYVPRPGFPENTVLERHLDGRVGTAALAADTLAEGSWEGSLEDLERGPRPDPADLGGASRAAKAIAELLAVDSVEVPD